MPSHPEEGILPGEEIGKEEGSPDREGKDFLKTDLISPCQCPGLHEPPRSDADDPAEER